jgi:hypothetical protein
MQPFYQSAQARAAPQVRSIDSGAQLKAAPLSTMLPRISCSRHCGFWRGIGLRRLQNEILAWARKKSGQQSGNALKEHALLRSECIFTIAFDRHVADLASSNLHGDENLFARAGHRHLAGMKGMLIFQQSRRAFAIDRKIDPDPAVVTSFNEQRSNIFERRMMKRWLIADKHAPDFRDQRSR